MAGISSPDSYSFNLAFAEYGESEDTISQEIKTGVTQAVRTAVRSVDFSRAEGVGIEGLENEINSVVQFVLYRAQITRGIQAYNFTVDDDHKVVISQELIDISTQGESREGMVINIRYYEQRNVLALGGGVQQNLNVPVN